MHATCPLEQVGLEIFPEEELLELVDEPLELELDDELELVVELPELDELLPDDEVELVVAPQKSASGSIEVTLSHTDVHCPKKNLHFAVPFPAAH